MSGPLVNELFPPPGYTEMRNNNKPDFNISGFVSHRRVLESDKAGALQYHPK